MFPEVLCPRRTSGGSWVRLLRYAPSDRQAAHAHDRSSITMVLRGDVEERVGTDLERAGAMSMVIKPAGVTHATTFGATGAVTVQIQLSPEDEARALEAGHAIAAWQWSHAGEAIRPMVALAQRLRDESGPAPNDPALDDLVLESLAMLPPLRPRSYGSVPRWLLSARESLMAESLSIRSVAAIAGVHPIHLAREFRRSFGIAPTEFRRRMRIRRAGELLARPGEPLAAVALEAGFADQAHMNREMRRTAGVTPAGMRRLTGT
jgi:AraC family transcriptional regulator